MTEVTVSEPFPLRSAVVSATSRHRSFPPFACDALQGLYCRFCYFSEVVRRRESFLVCGASQVARLEKTSLTLFMAHCVLPCQLIFLSQYLFIPLKALVAYGESVVANCILQYLAPEGPSSCRPKLYYSKRPSALLLKRHFAQKRSFCNYLLALMSFQIRQPLFLLRNLKMCPFLQNPYAALALKEKFMVTRGF